jgi:hypothetical protein
MPTERPPLLGEVVPTFADRGCCVVSATDPPNRIRGFLDRSRYYFFQVAPQLYSRGWVNPVPDPLPLRKSGSAGNRTQDLRMYWLKYFAADVKSESDTSHHRYDWKPIRITSEVHLEDIPDMNNIPAQNCGRRPSCEQRTSWGRLLRGA